MKPVLCGSVRSKNRIFTTYVHILIYILKKKHGRGARRDTSRTPSAVDVATSAILERRGGLGNIYLKKL